MKELNRPKETGETLREQGYRMTPQRQLILAALQQSNDHISAEEIHAHVCAIYPQVNISTIYRNLELLKKMGLVTETDLGSGRFRYHPAEKGHHHHLICEKCGATIETTESPFLTLRHTLLKEYRFRANISHLAIFGRCSKCRG